LALLVTIPERVRATESHTAYNACAAIGSVNVEVILFQRTVDFEIVTPQPLWVCSLPIRTFDTRCVCSAASQYEQRQQDANPIH
jgi:hypothetical protein